MKEIRREQIPEFVKKDVETVMKHARCVFVLGEHDTVVVRWNHDGGLHVCAVVGTSSAFGGVFANAVLCEIGLERSRPYRKAHKNSDKHLKYKQGRERGIYFPARKKWFSLSEKQYCLLAPILFRELAGYASEKMSHWKTDAYCTFLEFRSWKKRSSKKIVVRKRRHARFRGIRMSVDTRDGFLLRDICWADLRPRGPTEEILKHLRPATLAILEHYENRWAETHFLHSKWILVLLSLCRRWSSHVVAEIRISNPRWALIQKELSLDGAISLERQCAETRLSDPEKRIPETTRVRLVRGLRGNKSYIVFEMREI